MHEAARVLKVACGTASVVTLWWSRGSGGRRDGSEQSDAGLRVGILKGLELRGIKGEEDYKKENARERRKVRCSG